MPKLYYTPGTCSIFIHILLEEIGAAYERELIETSLKQQNTPAYLAINPKGKVPALVRDDGSVLTEVPAISMWLALTNPAAKLLPADVEGRARVMEIITYLSGTVHMQGAARAWRPLGFSDNPDLQEKVVAKGRDIVMRGLNLLSEKLGEKDYLIGDYCIADPFLFFIEYWAVEKVGYTLPNNVDAHYRRMRQRRAVQRALTAEGLD